uniref:Uncharacterized protein n=1 Tax=Oryza punctata TaxID=4537 RepID=A0A0E0KG37_ORYPU
MPCSSPAVPLTPTLCLLGGSEGRRDDSMAARMTQSQTHHQHSEVRLTWASSLPLRPPRRSARRGERGEEAAAMRMMRRQTHYQYVEVQLT